MAGRARGRALVGAVALGGAMALAGCSGDPDDDAATAVTTAGSTPTVDEPTGSETPTGPTGKPDPDPTEPVLPAAAEGTSVRSAKAFVHYYVDLLNYAMTTGDTDAFRAAARSTCSGCHDYVDFVDDIYSDGGYYRTKGWRELRVLLGGQDEDLMFTVTATASPVRYRLSSSAQVKQSERERFDFTVSVREVRDRWLASGISAG